MTADEAKQALNVIEFCKKEIGLLESEFTHLNSSEDIAELTGKIDSFLIVIEFCQKDLK